MEPTIQNMTATADLSYMQDLVGIKVLSDEQEKYTIEEIKIDYDPDRFRALIIRFKNPKATVLVYDSGKVVCVGGKKEQTASDAFSKTAQIIRELGFKAKVKNVLIHNYVGSWCMGTKIKIREFVAANPKSATYEHEIFPGCIYTLNCSKITIFHTGKVFMTGVREKKEMRKIFEHIAPKLKEFFYERKK